jgi:formimidoylglutamate deiminase
VIESALQPDRLYANGRLLRDVALNVDDRGRVSSIGEPAAGATRIRLAGKALLPGLVNAHSHAFQRTLRGRTEWRREGVAETFWSWREQMYRVAGGLGPEGLRIVARSTFTEMLLAGITTVGEFHYLHRDLNGRPYEDPNELGWQIRAAAEEAGIRLSLLRVAYRRGGRSSGLEGAQRRFDSGDPEEFMRDTEALAARASEDRLFSVGVAPHSVRAVPVELLGDLAREARRHGWPIHMHVAEQAAEVTASLAEHGRRPVEILADRGLLGPDFTAVHAIEILPHEAAALGQALVTVCACPTTERNLGDGVVPARLLQDCGVTLALGTDSQVQIDLLEDARELEAHLRLTLGQRAVLARKGDDPMDLARTLFAAATTGGARALGLPVGDLVASAPADFFTVDLRDPSIVGCDDAALLSALVFGLSPRAVRDVAVGGRLVVRDGHHAGAERSSAAFERLQVSLWS